MDLKETIDLVDLMPLAESCKRRKDLESNDDYVICLFRPIMY